MWIINKLGMFSIVANRDNKSQVLIRARVANDLALLMDFAGSKSIGFDTGIISLEDADYPHRAYMQKKEWVRLNTELAKTVTYANFKATVADPKRHDVYMAVWQILQRLTTIIEKGHDDNPLQMPLFNRSYSPPPRGHDGWADASFDEGWRWQAKDDDEEA